MNRQRKTDLLTAKFPAGDFTSGGPVLLSIQHEIPNSSGATGLTLKVNKVEVTANLFP